LSAAAPDGARVAQRVADRRRVLARGLRVIARGLRSQARIGGGLRRTPCVGGEVAARFKTGNLRLSATIPYIRINGANVVSGDGGPIVIDPNAPRVTRDGIGDLTLGANYAIPEEKLGFGLDLGGRVKLPVAETDLGTGKTDFSVSAEVSKTFGTVTPFVQGGYRWMGDPATIDLNNVFFASAGASVALGKSVLLVSYDYRQATTNLIDDSQELFGAFSAPLGKRLNFTLYGSAGLSEGAPDYGAGAMLTLKAF
jgi:hypothetical protein